MKAAILSALIVLYSALAGAQVYDKKIIHVNDNLSDHFTYLFPSFQEATVLFKTGGSLKSNMNFNTLLCNMQFIDPKGDTLELTKQDEIDSIRFNNSTFFFRNGYFQIIGADNGLKLVVSRKASFQTVKLGAMGLPASNVSVENYDSYTSNAKYVKALQLSANQDISVVEKTEYFFTNDKNDFTKASKGNFLKIFRDDKKRVESFLSANKINFNNQDDLRKLFQFCTHQ